MTYLEISTKLRKYLLRKYQQICIIRHTCSIKCKYLKNPLRSHFVFGILRVLFVRNKNIEKFFLSRVGILGSCEVKVTRSQQMITFLFIYIHLRYKYYWKAAEKRFPMILTSLKSNKK